jgi:hypothetical protein
MFFAEYRTIAGVAGPLVVVELVKVLPSIVQRSRSDSIANLNDFCEDIIC